MGSANDLKTIQRTFKKTHRFSSSGNNESLTRKFIALQQCFLIDGQPITSTDICIPTDKNKHQTVFLFIKIHTSKKLGAEDAKKAAVLLLDHDSLLSDSGNKPWPVGHKGKSYKYLKDGDNAISCATQKLDALQFNLYATNSEVVIRKFEFIVVDCDHSGCYCYPNQIISRYMLAQLTTREKNLITQKYQEQGDLTNLEVILGSFGNPYSNPRFVQAQLLKYKYYKKARSRNLSAEQRDIRKGLSSKSGEILHLLKVVKSKENSGGAIRGHEILLSLSSLGFKNIVLLPPGRLDRTTNSENMSLLHPLFINAEDEASYLSWEDEEYQDYSKTTKAEMLKGAAMRIAEFYNLSVVHAHSGFDGFDLAYVGNSVSSKMKIPFIYEVRSFHESTWSADKKYRDCSEHFNLRIQVENSYMNQADSVITICQTMKSEISNRGIDVNKITVIPNCIDTQRFNPENRLDKSLRQQLGLKEKFVVGYLSNMHSREGHLLLIQAIRRIVDMGHTDIHCLFFGKGTMEPAIDLLSKELDLESYVTLFGEVSNDRVVEAYNCYDLFVIPRVEDHAGNYVTPMKPFEAMGLGLPLLVSDLPALREIAGESERYAHLFKAGSVSSLVEKIIYLKNNYDCALEVSESAQVFASEKHNRERLRNGYLKLYGLKE